MDSLQPFFISTAKAGFQEYAIAFYGPTLADVERGHIESVLAQANWMLEGESGAARILNLHPSTLRSRMRKLGIKRPRPSTRG